MKWQYASCAKSFQRQTGASVASLKTAPFSPTQQESVRTHSGASRIQSEASSLRNQTASASDAGIEAKSRKRGPQNQPPYHAHHEAKTSISPTPKSSQS